MQKVSFFQILTLFALLGLTQGEDRKKLPEGAAELSLATIQGEMIRPLACDSDETKFAVLIFTTTDCPIANAYSPEFNRLNEFIGEKGGKLTLVHIDWDLTVEGASKHASDYALKPDVVIDRKHQLVHATGAEITPDAVLISPAGDIVYRGRISNLFSDYGDRRRVVTDHTLRNAIEAFVAGKPVEKPRVEALGCFIEAPPSSVNGGQ